MSRNQIRQKTDESQLVSYKDNSDKATVLTAEDIGSELPSVEYNSENGVESKQNHNH